MNDFGKRGHRGRYDEQSSPAPIGRSASQSFMKSKAFLPTMLAVVGVLWVIVQMLPERSKDTARTTSTANSNFSGIPMGLLKSRMVVDRPSEPSAIYTLLSVVNGNGQAVAINTRYSPNAGWSWTKAAIDCGVRRRVVLRSTFEKADFLKAKDSPARSEDLVPGSSADMIGRAACGVIGKPY